jgi:hypothetical protein
MKNKLKILSAVALSLALGSAQPSQSACCYFAAKDKDINQPAQKAFIAWDAENKTEAFTVQPKFEGNAADFGMVIPTPTRPKLNEMPREFFKELAVFTILEPMDLSKYKQMNFLYGISVSGGAVLAPKKAVKVLEAGVVGSLDYKIIQAEDAQVLFGWLKDNGYTYSGDEATLDFYIKKKWVFTTMKIDPTQMKKRPDGSYEGEVTPTRFTFATDKPIYPLKITQLSLKDQTEALFYVQSKTKMDLPGDLSYEPTFCAMWQQAISFAIPEKVTPQEKAWLEHLKGDKKLAQPQPDSASLEWAKKITANDTAIIAGEKPYNREAPKEDVEKMKQLKGIVKEGQWVTKFRKTFKTAEMTDDLQLVEAKVGDKSDEIEYFSILPTSPP